MNAKQFKKLLKEACREAVREELEFLLTDSPTSLKESKTLNFTSNDVPSGGLPIDIRNSLRSKMGTVFGFEQPQPINNISLNNENKNPYLNFIADTVNNMTAQDIAGIKNMG